MKGTSATMSARHLLRATSTCFFLALVVVALFPGTPAAADDAPRKIVFLAGEMDDHPHGTHEYERAVLLLQHLLETAPNVRGISTEAHFGGWPEDPATLEDADTIVLISGGPDHDEAHHPFLHGDRLSVIGEQMARGCGLVVIHWGVFVPVARGGPEFLDWIGGFFDYESGPPEGSWYSAIQTVTNEVTLPEPNHPVVRGVQAFELREEYYYKIRFREEDPRWTPLLQTAIPGEEELQTFGWAVEREDGGRGFGFTGGHFYDNYFHEPFQRVLLNAILWTAHVPVPEEGVQPQTHDAIRALILTGHHYPGHLWPATTEALRQGLEQDPRVLVTVVEDPEFLASPELRDFDVIVQNYNNWDRPGLSEAAQQGLKAYLRDGGAMSIVHFANGAWHFSLPEAPDSDWPEYRERIVARTWNHDGPSGHDHYGEFTVEIADPAHPIMEGAEDFDIVDELYFRQEGEVPIHVLATARSEITGEDEPQAFTYEYEGARMFQTVLGHDAQALMTPGLARLVRRGTVWAAGRAPADFPPQAGRASRPDPAAMGAPDPPVVAEPPPSDPYVEGRFGDALNTRVSPLMVLGRDEYTEPPLTVEAWAKLDTKESFNVVVSNEDKGSGTHWEIYAFAGSGYFSAYFPGYSPSTIQTSVDIVTGDWHYLAMTFDGGEVALFVDGVEAARQAVSRVPGMARQPGPLYIGQARHGPDQVPCFGLVDELRISERIRGIDGIPDAPFEADADTVGLWRFDEDPGPPLADHGRFANNAVRTPGPEWTPTRSRRAYTEEWELDTDEDWLDDRLQYMDVGRFFTGAFETPQLAGFPRTYKGIAVKLGDDGEQAMLFDTLLMRYAAGWEGNFLSFSPVRFGLIGLPTPGDAISFRTEQAPGWARAGDFTDPRPRDYGPLPKGMPRYKGLYLHGERVVFTYDLGGAVVLDSPWAVSHGGTTAFTRSIETEALDAPYHVRLFSAPGAEQREEIVEERPVRIAEGEGRITAAALIAEGSGAAFVEGVDEVDLVLEAGAEGHRLKVLLWEGAAEDLDAFLQLVHASDGPEDLRALTEPGPGRWAAPIGVESTRGADDYAYAVDSIGVPFDNPHEALMFTSDLGFLPNGDLVVSTVHGDVWLVSGIDEDLANVTWKRFATGLYQPLGVEVVDDAIYVLCRDQIVRLHDRNGNGEADFYEVFNNELEVTGGGHAYAFSLERDSEGYFYFIKSGNRETAHGGAMLRVSPDGETLEVFAEGYRHPNGMGIGPGDFISSADNEGNWVPATPLSKVEQGGFYGYEPAYRGEEDPADAWRPPFLWLPREADNSSGSQVWIDSDDWGPLSNQMLHFSFGRARKFLVMMDTVDGTLQGAAAPLPFRFLSGSMRATRSPHDGHLYVTGLDGWLTAGVQDGMLQRVRYTGAEANLPVAVRIHEDGIAIGFSEPLLEAPSPEDFTIHQWNYRWSGQYGSPHFSVANPEEEGEDFLAVNAVEISEDRRTVFLKIDSLQAVMQMRIAYTLETEGGSAMAGPIYLSIKELRPPLGGLPRGR